MSIRSLGKSEVLWIYSVHNCTPACVLGVGYIVVGVMEDIPPWIMSPLYRLLPVLEDPMIELQTIDVVQAVDSVYFDAFVITLSKG